MQNDTNLCFVVKKIINFKRSRMLIASSLSLKLFIFIFRWSKINIVEIDSTNKFLKLQKNSILENDVTFLWQKNERENFVMCEFY